MFLKKDNSFLLDYDRLEKIPAGTMHIHYWDEQEFPVFGAKKRVEAGKLMREVFENYSFAQERNEGLREHILSNYSIEKVCSRVKKRLEEIWDKC
jgi:hypothetical protein